MIARLMSRCALALVLALPCVAAAHAQDFPSKPITILVGISAGGITDISTRLYAEVVSKSIGQKIIIENRPGAGGAIAAAAVQNATPDGYTLLVFSGSQHSAVPAVQSAPYDPVKGFQPVSLLFNLAALLVVPTTSPANTVAELLDHGKKKSGGLLFGSPGVGTPSHLLAAKISDATKTPMQYVHYRGGSPMMADLVTGRVEFALASYTVSKGFYTEKKLKALAVDAAARLKVLPDIPTLTEAGLGNVKVASWFAIAAPAGTPANVVAKLNGEFAKAARDPELQRRMTENGTLLHTSTPEEMGKLLAEEVESTNKLVKALGLGQK
jgi:tripartite-type tricarboxylate transporter receptor subunit TctC